ncbi:hypothetical protein [Pseudonocardia asaccharolytica]|uniref:Transglycosylase SLT domain-containing protein n=1 Tax=Pseudonocardia asaccharolytica DSM 44247 = NBRC 16224 TaxID=1123024 RepID=A0A511CZK3_9PSEU|nr:hypothetical protein [Pseudonocardia asaccharolytica]GEL17703.1 hypothetical protein PA7_15400 [Pseudonocardia asaccharolytica DSM 44247 = NBRC 16224]
MSAVDSLAAWGILRAPEVAAIAAGVGLELAAAATLLEKESAGGRNVWGHDSVSTGGYYEKGGPVTRENYTAWKPHRGRLGSQGVGPCQLTWPGYQDQADRAGGCWDPLVSMRVGFAVLAGHIGRHGLRDGFRRYNGSGPAAERYADDAMAKLAKWRDRLGTHHPSPAPRGGPLMALSDAEQGELLALVRTLHHQLYAGEGDPATGRAGWRTWAGGTDETLTVVDYLRRANVETRQLHPNLISLHQKVDRLTARETDRATPPAGPGGGAPVDLDALAARVVELLAQRLAQSNNQER